MDKKELPLIDLFPEADIRIADTTTVPEDDIVTTVVPTTTIAGEETTTVEPTTTTENPANFAKTGSLEVLVADIVSSGHMLHWSSGQQYLAIADMWGQKYIRYEEVWWGTTTTEPPSATVLPTTTVLPT